MDKVYKLEYEDWIHIQVDMPYILKSFNPRGSYKGSLSIGFHQSVGIQQGIDNFHWDIFYLLNNFNIFRFQNYKRSFMDN